MKYFLDSAKLDEIKYAYENYGIDGVTTNPKHIKLSGKPFMTCVKEIAQWLKDAGLEGKDFPVSFEINPHLDKADDIVAAAKEVASYSPNYCIKIPCCKEGLIAARRLEKEGVRTNVTLVFSPSQAIPAAKLGAKFVSPFVGWKENSGDSSAYLKEIAKIYKNYQVVVKIEYCGICGSDMHFFQNGAIGTRKAPPDFILGHESAGTVIEVGKDVTTLKVGDRVALEPGVPCGKCQYCKSGKYNLCPDVHFLAAAKPPTNGALRNYFAYPAEWCFKLPDNVSTMEGTMLEPLSVGMHAAGRGGAELGKTALIIGVGTIGYMTMLACKAMGVSKIIVSDALENRLALALQHGADYAINVKNEDAVEKVMEYTDGEGCDIVFETAGSPVTLASTWKYVKTAGVIVNVGNASGEIPFVFGELARKEVDIRSVWRYRNIYPIAIEAVRTGKIDLKHIEPAMFPFEKSQEAFEYAFEHRSEVLKTIIQVTE